MRPIMRNLLAAGMVMGACALASPVSAQGKSDKTNKAVVKADKSVAKSQKKYDKAVQKNTRVVNRTSSRTHSRVLCADGIWVTRTTDACINHDGVAARQGDYGTTPRASDRARERASPNSAVRRSTNPYANNISTNAIARCMDGTYWHATTRTNACYRHGGVATWL
jgi:hypothetical protein